MKIVKAKILTAIKNLTPLSHCLGLAPISNKNTHPEATHIFSGNDRIKERTVEKTMTKTNLPKGFSLDKKSLISSILKPYDFVGKVMGDLFVMGRKNNGKSVP